MHAKFGVLVTRPETLAAPLIAALEEINAKVWHYPTLKIKFLSEDPKVQDAIKHFTTYQWHIFVSRHAVQSVMPQITKTWSILDLSQLNFAAVGPGSAKELNQYLNKALRKTQLNPIQTGGRRGLSHAQLASMGKSPQDRSPFGREPSFCVNPFKEVLCPKTDLGAAALSQILVDKIQPKDKVMVWCGDKPTKVWPNAKMIMCYRREKNTINLEEIERAIIAKEIQYILVTSGESLECLLEPGLPRYARNDGGLNSRNDGACKLVVISERLIKLARTLGFTGEIILAKGADDQSMINAIKGDLI